MLTIGENGTGIGGSSLYSNKVFPSEISLATILEKSAFRELVYRSKTTGAWLAPGISHGGVDR
ncbi:MAG: hypothetical protein CMJ81_19125 [Planctomycetaceae bacterium]|nr:hypothetical protein [Planctomycetaceae bacterium]MBP61645.1 hypothetical protein [Planctomycetaceae bacterium]